MSQWLIQSCAVPREGRRLFAAKVWTMTGVNATQIAFYPTERYQPGRFPAVPRTHRRY